MCPAPACRCEMCRAPLSYILRRCATGGDKIATYHVRRRAQQAAPLQRVASGRSRQRPYMAVASGRSRQWAAAGGGDGRSRQRPYNILGGDGCGGRRAREGCQRILALAAFLGNSACRGALCLGFGGRLGWRGGFAFRRGSLGRGGTLGFRRRPGDWRFDCLGGGGGVSSAVGGGGLLGLRHVGRRGWGGLNRSFRSFRSFRRRRGGGFWRGWGGLNRSFRSFRSFR